MERLIETIQNESTCILSSFRRFGRKERNDYFPIASIVPFEKTKKGYLIICLTQNCEHTGHFRSLPQVGITIYNSSPESLKEAWRVSLMGSITLLKKFNSVSSEAKDKTYYKVTPYQYLIQKGFGQKWKSHKGLIKTDHFESESYSRYMEGLIHYEPSIAVFTGIETQGFFYQSHGSFQYLNFVNLDVGEPESFKDMTSIGEICYCYSKLGKTSANRGMTSKKVG